MSMEDKLHYLLENFISQNSWEHGHSAGKEEVESIAESLRFDLREVNDLINELLEFKYMYESVSK